MQSSKSLALSLVSALTLVTFGCGEDAQPTDIASVQLAPAGFDLPVSESSTPKPAWQTDDEIVEAKADSFDVRGGYEDIFGVTAAPRQQTRAIAEFEATDGVLIDWDDYMSDYMFDLVSGVVGAAPVYILTDNIQHSNQIRQYLSFNGVDTTSVSFFEFQNDAVWTRDFGPIPVAMADGSAGIIDSRYYPNRQRDDAVPELLGRYFDVPVYRPNLSTEGGNFMSNGEGLCVATEWIWQENPGLTEREVATINREYYGCSDLVVVERMAQEGTGHVDMFAKFLSRDTVLVGDYTSRQDPTNAAILDRNAARLSQVRLADGSSLNVVRVPMPSPRNPVFRSYTNSLIVNDTVLVPVYPSDRAGERTALETYQNLMPGYRIVPIDADDIIEIGGAIHCTTMGFNTGAVAPADDTRPEPEPEPQPTETYESQANLEIRDLETISDTIVVAENGAMDTVIITLDVDHTYVGDLNIYLEFQGSQIALHQQTGGSADGIKRSYTLDGSGLDPAGEWTLVIEDRAQQDQGTLNSWSLAF